MSPDLDAWKQAVTHLNSRMFDYRLLVICLRCNHQRILDPLTLARWIHPETLLVDAMVRMRCSKCGHRGARHEVERKLRERGRPPYH